MTHPKTMQLAMGEVAAILGASCGVPERLARGYSIDSRTLAPGQLFFAIRGPRFDGHDFVRQVFVQGAVGAVVEHAFRERAELALASAFVPVRDTSEALKRLAQAVRRKWGRRVIAVTGSTGKTTTKEMISTLLAERFSALKSPGNLNNNFGLPLTLLRLEPEHEVAVVELAMSMPGEIAQLAQIAEPQVGVVTNVAPVHLEFFESVDSIAKAKRELLENLFPQGGPATAVLNHDDARVRGFREGFAGRVMTFGFDRGAEVRASQLRPVPGGGTQFRVIGPGIDCEFQLPVVGRHNVENALAAIATATLFDIPPAELQHALAGFRNLHQRCEILTLAGVISVLNDSYNSNPLAMEKLLETLAAWPQARRRIVVAGEMLELGPTSAEWHRKIGRRCAENGVDWLLAVQGDARFFIDGAVEAGLSSERCRFYANPEPAGEFCRTLLQPGDVVLVKGSRAVRLEKVIELLQSGRVPFLSSSDAGHKD